MAGDIEQMPQLVIEQQPSHSDKPVEHANILPFSVRLEGAESLPEGKDHQTIVLSVWLWDENVEEQVGKDLVGTITLNGRRVQGLDEKVRPHFIFYDLRVRRQGIYMFAILLTP